MRAILDDHVGNLTLEEIPRPTPQPGKVLIAVAACGVCGSEYKKVKPRTGATPAKRRTIPGHEIAGSVAAFGDGAPDFLHEGLRVAVAPNTRCGFCDNCRRGHTHLCLRRGPNYAKQGGGYAEYVVVEPYQCHELPDGLSLETAALTEPIACCVHAAAKAAIRPGERVLIVGAGANALFFAQLAKLQGAAPVAIVDDIPERLALARKLGADIVVDSDREDPLEAAPELRRGADVVFVNRSKVEITARAVAWCDTGARLVCFGVAPAGTPAPIEPHALFQREISVIGSRSYAAPDFSAALSLLARGRIRVDRILNRKVTLEDVVRSLKEPGNQIKTIVTSS